VRLLRLGTRGSALALAQTTLVCGALERAFPGIDLRVQEITTTGDRKVDMSLVRQTPAGAKGLFTKEIEDLLLDGIIDFAVHSLKDLAGATSKRLEVVSVLERAPTSDVLISKQPVELASLPERAVIGTSSVRRRRQLLSIRPDLQIAEHRGNVPTRLRKLSESNLLDAIVLARAGLVRLGYDLESLESEGVQLYVEDLGDVILPAIGQGAIALQCRADDEETRDILEEINHRETFTCIRAERELLRLLEGDCQLPVGARTRIEGESLKMEAVVFDISGCRRGSGVGPKNLPEQVATTVYHSLIEQKAAG
jgi:hydroxymethylbilane synthase